MKIIFLEAVQDHGGARKSTLELAERLQNNGAEVSVIDFYGSNTDFVEDAKSKNLQLTILSKRNSPFIIQDKNYFKYLKNIIQFFFQSRKMKKKLSDVLSGFSADFIIVNNRKTLSIIPKNNNNKIIFFARGWFINKQIPKLDKILMKKKVDIYMAVSQSTRQALYCSEMQSLDNIHVVKNGIDLDKINQYNRPKNNIFTIVHSGGFIPDKGQQICLEIAAELKKKQLPFKLILTGKVYEEPDSQNYYQFIKESIKKINIEKEVEIIKNRNNILDVIASAHVLIHPSSTEGLPRVLMEAMALRTAVISNPVGGVTDFILDGYTGFLTDYNSVENYVEKLELLQNNAELKETITKNAFELIKTCYTANGQAESMLKLLTTELK